MSNTRKKVTPYREPASIEVYKPSLLRRVLSRNAFAALFAEYTWYRKAVGGHWERWHIDAPVNSRLWCQQEHGVRFGLQRGTPTCEDWP